MSACGGNGLCFNECYCICFDEETDVDNEVCTCGHREHNVKYCRTMDCSCEMVQCKNFAVCATVMPGWSFDRIPGSGLCFDCWAYRGLMKKSSEVEGCAICMEEKVVIGLSCHPTHKMCLECWDKTIESKPFPSCCPLCRASIGGWKLNVGAY